MKEHFLDIDTSVLNDSGAYYTAVEISRQPESWNKTLNKLIDQKEQLTSFLNGVYTLKDLQIVLTGAGSSAFLGEVLQYAFRVHIGKDIKAIPTTDLVTHFQSLIQCDKPLLLISFARSGNSPESLATIDLANELCRNGVFHLIITCNQEGKLVSEVTGEHVFTFLLPGETNDQSLAMTNSFSSMALAGFLIADLEHIEHYKKEVALLRKYANSILTNSISKIRQVSRSDFTRAIFLGSGPLLGIARESHLKLQELTDGNVICKFDSFMGFRHGPKAVVDDKTLIVYLLSSETYIRQYEVDLINEIYKNQFGEQSLALTEHPRINYESDNILSLAKSDEMVDPSLLGIVYVMVAQLLGFYKSLSLGLEPDNPSRKGAISRVVEGVEIYPYENHNSQQ